MTLPRYGPRRTTVPVVDHRTSPSGWSVPTAYSTSTDADIENQAHEPTEAERARTVLASNRTGVLSVGVGEQNVPLGLVVPYGLDDTGEVLLGIRPALQAAARLDEGVRTSFTVAETVLTASHSAANGGVTVLGSLLLAAADRLEALFSIYGRSQPTDVAVMRRGGSTLYRLEAAAYLVYSGNSEVMSISPAEYSAASSDPLAAVAPGLVSHLSGGGDGGGSLVLLCRAYAGEPSTISAQLTSIDQYGMDVTIQVPDGMKTVRLSFNRPLSNADEVRRELAAMARAARFKLGVG